MKKVFLTLMSLLMASTVYAGGRGHLDNVYASWLNVANNVQSTMTMPSPYVSRDVWIRNGDDTDVVCVSPNGATISTAGTSGIGQCRSTTDAYVTQLDPGAELFMTDFSTSSITFLGQGGAASPVSVIITY